MRFIYTICLVKTQRVRHFLIFVADFHERIILCKTKWPEINLITNLYTSNQDDLRPFTSLVYNQVLPDPNHKISSIMILVSLFELMVGVWCLIPLSTIF
jgi:hypothetical protein